MVETAKACIHALELAPAERWAGLFVELKLAFCRKYSNGLICSTVHGVDFFQNVVDVAEGRLIWEEEGQYGENFRRMVLK